ncbi:MAG: glycosyltransferase [Clostridia bacterium]|nr:glycosyltransferase [Clostridia bacterium]
MKILFLGYAVNPELASKLSGASVAGNKMQVNVLSGLASFDDVEINSITVYPVAAFPREKTLYFKNEIIDVISGVKSIRVPFVNLPVVKQLWQTAAVKQAAKKIVDKDTIVLTFNLFPQVGLPMACLKKKFGCGTYCLLADLPIDDNSNSKNPIRNFLRKIFEKKTIDAIKACDKFVTLNSRAMELFAPDKPYIVVEGGVENEKLKNIPKAMAKENKTIIYSGALTEYSGVLELIEAMKYVNDKDAVLEIYGGGYLADKIDEITDKTSNVKYCGRVTNEEMLKIQQNAFLLVNPRPVNDPISQVTFPSKIFEYMLSGTPVLTTKLSGLSDDYFKYMFSADKDNAKGLADGINKALSTSAEDLIEMADGASKFVAEEKSWQKQCNRMYEFLK